MVKAQVKKPPQLTEEEWNCVFLALSCYIFNESKTPLAAKISEIHSKIEDYIYG